MEKLRGEEFRQVILLIYSPCVHGKAVQALSLTSSSDTVAGLGQQVGSSKAFPSGPDPARYCALHRGISIDKMGKPF